MPSDDPISSLQVLNASDDRQRSRIQSYAKYFLDIIKLFASPGTALPISGVSAALDWLAQRSAENLSELVDVLADEIKHRGAQVERLIEESENHRRFIAEEMPGLVLDALAKAEHLRAKDRIGRLARILLHAAEVGPRHTADYVEEMLRVATNLDERDVSVLRGIVRVQGRMVDQAMGRVKHYSAYSVRRETMGSLRVSGFAQGEIDSRSAKLEGFGLVSRTERNVNVLADDPAPYALLGKGLDFIEYIKSATDKAQ